VCDIESSSKYLNNNESAEGLETFLQRFLFLSMIFVEAAGGTFVKWTGDGFLAWFETPLHRDVGDAAFRVFNAAWMLSFYTNISQLGVQAKVKFKIRHAVTLEHDALVIDLAYSDKRATDVLGRAVVLAFRLSSIGGRFPSVVTHRELLKLCSDTSYISFKKLKLSRDEKLKYFKDEAWGTSDIFVSGDKPRKTWSTKTLISRTRKFIKQYHSRPDDRNDRMEALRVDFATKFVTEMASGPRWCQDVLIRMEKFQKEAYGVLKEFALEAGGIGENARPKKVQTNERRKPTHSN